MGLEEQLPYYYWLHTVQGIGNKTIRTLRSAFRTPEQIYKATVMDLKPFLTEAQLRQLISHKQKWDVKKEYQLLKQKKIHMYPMLHPDYPERLKKIPDSPQILYALGELPAKDRLSVAIIGARMCSQYGRYMAREFAIALANAGIQVISGMALGVDGISQRAALQSGTNSYAVLGSGVDICYPKENEDIYKLMCSQGGIISEYPPGTTPIPRNFPPRNRIISGLADVILVIEAKDKSGTSITVDMALEQGKEVYALPGRVNDALSRGCNQLIRQGAAIATSPEEFIEELNNTYGRKQKSISTKIQSESYQQQQLLFLSPVEETILHIMDITPMPIHQIHSLVCEKKSISIPELMDTLMTLCLKQIIIQQGSYYMLKK